MPRHKTSYSQIVRNRHQATVKRNQPSPLTEVSNIKKRVYHHKSGVAANMEIRRLQRSIDPCIPLTPFARFVKELVQDQFSYRQLYRMTKGALLALRSSAEDFLVHLFEDCVRAADHRHRKTITPEV